MIYSYNHVTDVVVKAILYLENLNPSQAVKKHLTFSCSVCEYKCIYYLCIYYLWNKEARDLPSFRCLFSCKVGIETFLKTTNRLLSVFFSITFMILKEYMKVHTGENPHLFHVCFVGFYVEQRVYYIINTHLSSIYTQLLKDKNPKQALGS